MAELIIVVPEDTPGLERINGIQVTWGIVRMIKVLLEEAIATGQASRSDPAATPETPVVEWQHQANRRPRNT